MPNLRIISDNAADRATLTASSQASADMAVANLRTDIKTHVWRSTGTTATLTATWSALETIGGVVLPFCNLTPLATIRVRGYSAVGDAVPLFDTGVVDACPGPVLGLWGWGAAPLGSNAFAYGGGTYGRVWIPVPGAVRKLVVDISDPTNPAGYIEAARLVCGAYWEPQYNASYGAPLTMADGTTLVETAAGDLMPDIGTRRRVQSIDLSMIPAHDRAAFWDIVNSCGLAKPMLFSLYPNGADAKLEQAHQLYCRLDEPATVSTPHFQRYATTIKFKEV